MVIPPAGADDGMLTDVAVALPCAFDEAARLGVTEGGSGAKAPSMQRSAQSARKKGSTRIMAA